MLLSPKSRSISSLTLMGAELGPCCASQRLALLNCRFNYLVSLCHNLKMLSGMVVVYLFF